MLGILVYCYYGNCMLNPYPLTNNQVIRKHSGTLENATKYSNVSGFGGSCYKLGPLCPLKRSFNHLNSTSNHVKAENALHN